MEYDNIIIKQTIPYVPNKSNGGQQRTVHKREYNQFVNFGGAYQHALQEYPAFIITIGFFILQKKKKEQNKACNTWIQQITFTMNSSLQWMVCWLSIGVIDQCIGGRFSREYCFERSNGFVAWCICCWWWWSTGKSVWVAWLLLGCEKTIIGRWFCNAFITAKKLSHRLPGLSRVNVNYIVNEFSRVAKLHLTIRTATTIAQ